ncbi:MAG: rfaG [Verrucomicrobiales bacterium]|nr:rfaG [Verrucomicrobiales bacterium]
MSPLRIIHLNSLLTGGGTDDQCVKVAHGLQQLGQDVRIAGPAGRDFSRIIDALNVPFCNTGDTKSKTKFILRAAKFIREFNPHIVHGHHGRDIWPTIMATRLSGVRPKLVLTRHMAKSPSSWASRKFMLAQCDAVIVVSNFVEKILTQGMDDRNSPERERCHRPPIEGDFKKIHVIYPGIDTTKFRPALADAKRNQLGLKPEHFAFAVTGGYHGPRGKGQREFLRAAASIHNKIPNARFLIIGRGNMESTLKADIEQLGLQGKAWLTGQMSDMPQVMNAIDCLVHPQIGTEALALVLCEAYACGKPVIASDLDGIPEAFVIGNLGQLVPPEDVNKLAEAMVAQVNAPRPTDAQKNEMHARVEGRFSLQRAASETLALYRGLVASKI